MVQFRIFFQNVNLLFCQKGYLSRQFLFSVNQSYLFTSTSICVCNYQNFLFRTYYTPKSENIENSILVAKPRISFSSAFTFSLERLAFQSLVGTQQERCPQPVCEAPDEPQLKFAAMDIDSNCPKVSLTVAKWQKINVQFLKIFD